MLFDLYISIFYIQFSDLFYFEFSRKKYRLSFVIAKMDTQLIINKPVTTAFKIFIQLFFNLINIFMLTQKACIISIKKKITFDSLWHIINIYEKEQRAKNRPLRYTTGHTCRLGKCIPQIYEIRSKPIYRMFRETNSIQFLQQNVMIDCIKGFL